MGAAPPLGCELTAFTALAGGAASRLVQVQQEWRQRGLPAANTSDQIAAREQEVGSSAHLLVRVLADRQRDLQRMAPL